MKRIALGFVVLLSGCGYPGEPQPPALNRPVRATDLVAVQRGASIYIQFTVPEATTENLPLRERPDIELRVGPFPESGFTFEKWESGSERVPESAMHIDEIEPPAPTQPKGKPTDSNKSTKKKFRPNAQIVPATLHAEAKVDASKLYGKTVVVGVRVHGSHGQDIGWSRLETLSLVPALPVPEALAALDAPDAIRLDWHAGAPEYRVFRKGPDDTAFRQIGTSEKPFYVDSTIEYGKSYEYQVQSIEKAGDHYAESEPSAGIAFQPTDKFPPTVPTGLTAVPGARTIELVWDRNTERDFASYQVYRDGRKVAEGLTAPSYSDRDVKQGARYRYQVSAADTAGNASALCAAVEAAIP